MASQAEFKDMSVFVYDLLLWIMSVILDLFFREVHPRSAWKIPRQGPVLFVAAPHANQVKDLSISSCACSADTCQQFVDPLLLMRVIRTEAHRRLAILIAAKSSKRKFIGWMAQKMGALPVGRALDTSRPAPGRIYMPDPDNDQLLLRGVGTNFEDPDVQVGGLVVLPAINHVSANAEIAEVQGPEQLKLKNPMKGVIPYQQLTGRPQQHKESPRSEQTVEQQINGARNDQGTTFSVAPKVDQTKVYDAVHDKLGRGGCIGIYPEGGSHDRTELLPLKAGVAIMALGVLAKKPDCGLKIVPCGMNYFHAHKFRSRAVIEFGTPLEVPENLVTLYRNGERRDAIKGLLEMIHDALMATTVTSPDYETLMLIQDVRRLYNPQGKRLPLPMVVELNRRLVKGYTHYRDDLRIVNLRKNIVKYHKSLEALGVRDHQVAYATLSVAQVLGKLFWRLGTLALLSTAVLPGLILFAPVFIAGKLISIKKSREALAASSVKIQARDVVATWKLLVAMALAPTLYTWYNILFGIWTWYNRIQGMVPDWVPIWLVVTVGFILFPMITYAALRFGETGMDIAKSLWPLILCLNPSSSNSLVQVRRRRQELANEVTSLINELGPELFPDFESQRVIMEGESPRPKTPDSPSRPRSWSSLLQLTPLDPSVEDGRDATTRASLGGGSSFSGHLPRNESFKNLSNVGIFASQPQTPSTEPSRSRTGSRPGSRPPSRGGFTLKPLSQIESSSHADDVSRRIRSTMRERGRHRMTSSTDFDADSDVSSTTSTSEVEEFSDKKTV